MDTRLTDVVASVGVIVASVLLGGVTSWAQGFLPESLSSFANSSSGWMIITALLVWAVRRNVALSAFLGAASFLALVLGYTGASALRGLTYSPVMFGVIGVVVGPVIGIAAAWLRCRGWRLALAVSALSGVAIGEAIYGLTVVADTTSPVYWVGVGLLGLALIAAVTVRQRSDHLPAVSGMALTAVVATAFVVVYRSVGT